jgi:glutamine amidotransferase
MEKVVLAILDYGMANLRSVQKAFERNGHAARIISTPAEVKAADRLVVPGVGAFKDAIAVIQAKGLDDALRAFVAAGRPMLGICLGLQLLMDVSFEDGEFPGLAIIPGSCERFTVDGPPLNLKVPHMGWNAITPARDVPLFKGLPPESYVYFVHGYHVRPADKNVIAATTQYGGPFVSAVWKDNLMATQFHPEKSQAVGGLILQNFVERT